MGPSDDADFEAITVPASAKFGGGALLLLGVLTLVLCLQTVLIVARYDSLMVPIISVMFALGAACMVLGFRITRGSGNIFADLGFADAAGRQAKLRLAYVVNQLLEKPRSRKAGRITVLTAYRRTLP